MDKGIQDLTAWFGASRTSRFPSLLQPAAAGRQGQPPSSLSPASPERSIARCSPARCSDRTQCGGHFLQDPHLRTRSSSFSPLLPPAAAGRQRKPSRSLSHNPPRRSLTRGIRVRCSHRTQSGGELCAIRACAHIPFRSLLRAEAAQRPGRLRTWLLAAPAERSLSGSISARCLDRPQSGQGGKGAQHTGTSSSKLILWGGGPAGSQAGTAGPPPRLDMVLPRQQLEPASCRGCRPRARLLPAGKQRRVDKSK